MKNKMLSLILTAALASSLFACGSSGPAEDTTGVSDTSSSDTTTGAEIEEPGPVLNMKPEDNGGAEYRILTTNYAANEYVVEEENGDIINDAVYRRNMAVEELLGIKFSYIVGTTSAGADKEAIELNKLIQTSVSANDDVYDLICSTVVRTLPAAVNGYFVDINTTSIDLSNPWWITTLSDEISINGKLFGVMGDLSLSLYRDISVIYFNKALFEDYKLENPYDLVRRGTWTLDKYLTLAQNGEKDVDGNGEIDPAVDQLWSVGQMVPNRAFLTSCNIQLVERDDDSIKLLTLPETLVDVSSKLYPFFNSDYTYVDPTGDHQLYAGYFASGRALFMNSYLYQTDYLRGYTD